MAIESKDIKLLWGRSAGLCAHCRTDLTYVLTSQEVFTIGEMAHVIARKENGPRGSEAIDPELRDSYQNLILLCNNHHEMIDKSPQSYSVTQILEWKQMHEEFVRSKLAGEYYPDKPALFESIKRILAENHSVYKQYGPKSQVALRNPMSLAKEIWDAQKLVTLIPNNKKIVNLVETNTAYLTGQEYNLFIEFKMHALSFENNAYERQDDESVTLFPGEFREMIFNGGL